MNMERPDLSEVSPDVLAYIEALEAEVTRLQQQRPRSAESARPPEPDEPPTTLNVITISASGMAKRTPRHLYSRQRRGGMGVFDLETDKDDFPAIVKVADEQDTLLFFTNFGRAFRLPVSRIPPKAVRDTGESMMALLPFRPNERIAAALIADSGRYAALVNQRGRVRRVTGSRLGAKLIPGMSFLDIQNGGYLTAACWTSGNDELFIATRQGKGIRFAEQQVHESGTLGLRVEAGDEAVAMTAVTANSGVFLLGHDGKGTIRLMSGFRANKSPGAGGKIAMKTSHLVGAFAVTGDDDIFAISQTGKIVRFRADEVPPKEGVVQGVNCMALRNDVVTAVARG